MLNDRPGVVGSGSNGGFQTLNLTVQFGCRFIILVGFDMRHGDDGAVHWHGEHPKGLTNPRPVTLDRWRKIIDEQAGWLKAKGVQVVNASPASALQAYPKLSLPEALERFAACRSVSA